MPQRFFLLPGLVFALTRLALGQNRGVIDDINILAHRSRIEFYPLARAAAKGETAAMQSSRPIIRRTCAICSETSLSPFEGKAYLKRYFPKTAAILSDSAFFGLFG